MQNEEMQDPIAKILLSVAKHIDNDLRPPPSTILALRTLNGAIARFAKRFGYSPEDLDMTIGEGKHDLGCRGVEVILPPDDGPFIA